MLYLDPSISIPHGGVSVCHFFFVDITMLGRTVLVNKISLKYCFRVSFLFICVFPHHFYSLQKHNGIGFIQFFFSISFNAEGLSIQFKKMYTKKNQKKKSEVWQPILLPYRCDNYKRETSAFQNMMIVCRTRWGICA